MRRILILSIVMLAFVVPSIAQQQTPARTSETVQATAEQQKALVEAMMTADKAAKEAELAKAKADTAQAQANALFYKIMALLKLSPEEWKPILDDKGLRFERVKTQQPSPAK